MTAVSPQQAYQQALAAGFKEDSAQLQAVECLELCYQQLMAHEPTVRGVYLWGPVGRGKTWLMDSFYNSVNEGMSAGSSVPAKRLHFHHFMRWVHQRLFQLSGQPEPLTLLAQELASEARVLCLDELYINDIGDAMLLSRLLQQLFAQGLVLVVTSNQPPEKLYENGFNRERLLPAIAAINQHLQVLSVAGVEDHRLHPGQLQQRFWVGLPQALAAVFAELAPDFAQEAGNETAHKSRHEKDNQPALRLGHRDIKVVQRSEQVLWCKYADLCEQPLSAADFIELCDQFSTILLSEVPQLACTQSLTEQQVVIARGTEDGVSQVAAGDRELPALSRQDDGVRRFIALVDECYDRQIPIYISAAVPLSDLYGQGALAFPFRRTLSRLQAMQLARFGQ
ncbi:cell division protein ZapE [Oceanisphaera profunda]|uniref:Cell division protein ZapE n=1 Tax=Oceanisphaera profunda TaxID=1416627 RepID=A0A1Y0D418_9GAMM|nr:cell division protein ZapE [Oceanisphaera profunda]ART81936.1 cell division protein ZapE [Oceanisphaera profunda]